MQIVHLGIIILSSINSTPPLPWPPVNQKCQITHVDLWEFEFWCDMKWSPTDSAENQLGLNQTLHSAFSNITVQIHPRKKNRIPYET